MSEQKAVYSLEGYKVLAKELESRLEKQIEAIDSLKGTGRQILAAGSLITGLVGGLQLIGVKIAEGWYPLYAGSVFVSFVLYLAMIAICIKVISPLVYKLPLPTDWNILREVYVKGKTERDVYRQLIADYISAIDANRDLVTGRERLTTYATYLLPATVIVLLLTSLIPRAVIP